MSKNKLKYFQNDPYLTPNNYDIYFNKDEIPSNIVKDSDYILEKKLQKLMPLTKLIHLDFECNSKKFATNEVIIFSSVKFNGKKVDIL